MQELGNKFGMITNQLKSGVWIFYAAKIKDKKPYILHPSLAGLAAFAQNLMELDIVNNTLKTSIMANIKKMDDHDFVFVNKTLTAKEEKEFSDFLKKRKSGLKTRRNPAKTEKPKKELA